MYLIEFFFRISEINFAIIFAELSLLPSLTNITSEFFFLIRMFLQFLDFHLIYFPHYKEVLLKINYPQPIIKDIFKKLIF